MSPPSSPRPEPSPARAGLSVLGVDASRNRSGGAVRHLLGLLGGADPRDHGISRVHLWAYRELADAVPRHPWLTVHSPDALRGSLPLQLWWQFHELPRLASSLGCGLVFNTDAGSVCPFRPAVTLSQDLLSYEPGEMARFGWTAARLRLLALRHVQNRSFLRSAGVIFLTRHAAATIQKVTGPLPATTVIPHGIDPAFRRPGRPTARAADDGSLRLVYVSEASPYKHPWNVVRAVGLLRGEGHRVRLLLVGGGRGRALRRLEAEIRRTDPAGGFVTAKGFVDHAALPHLLHDSDIFVFASSCENLPITLLEGMAAGLPIACSDRGPMPEVLGSHGVYFDPESPTSIADALRRLVVDPPLRETLARGALAAADRYSWATMSRDTWAFLTHVAGQSA